MFGLRKLGGVGIVQSKLYELKRAVIPLQSDVRRTCVEKSFISLLGLSWFIVGEG